jgi:hypothetical protein
VSIPGLAREIVAKRVAILAAVPTLYAVLVGAGVKFPWTSEQVVSYVGAGITVLSVAVGIFWARKDVTPVASPTDKQGRPLTPDTPPGL